MKNPPRSPGDSLLAGGLGVHVIWVGLLLGLVCLGTQAWAIKTGAHWQTMVFTVLCLSQLGHALAIRSEKRSLFQMGILSNKPLLYSVLLTVLLQLAVIYVPWCNNIFRTAPLPPRELALALGLSSLIFFAVEAEKLLRRRSILRDHAGRAGFFSGK